jgi:hypothetical protein
MQPSMGLYIKKLLLLSFAKTGFAFASALCRLWERVISSSFGPFHYIVWIADGVVGPFQS